MTNAELYSSVAQLGFETVLEDETRYILTANRAIFQVNALRPQTRVLLINHSVPKNSLASPSFDPKVKYDELIYYGNGARAYYFESDGIGECYIEALDGEEWTTIGLVHLNGNGAYIPYRGFITRDGEVYLGEMRLRFAGDYIYGVKSVALYEYLRTRRELDIPAYEPFTAYDMSVLAPDFLSLSSPPVIEYSEGRILNGDFSIENGRVLLLPYDKGGLYKVRYNRKPSLLIDTGDAAEDSTVIDLDEELCSLLPILIASYIWADDEPEKAQYYLTLYYERANDIKKRSSNLNPVKIRSIYN